MTSRLPDGVLVVDKPSGPTSFDVVRRIKRAAHVKRVGHGGTLDPLASGVLPICVGEGTKLAAFLLDADKEYDFTLRLGVETDTYDAQGAVTARRDPSAVEEAHVRGALAVFTGRIEQTPPIYSALKRDGRPLYAYARAGETVEIAPRAVTVHELTLTSFRGPDAVGLRVRCSKGTYVRSLAFDLGRRLGVGAHVTALRRTRSGPFDAAASLRSTPSWTRSPPAGRWPSSRPRTPCLTSRAARSTPPRRGSSSKASACPGTPSRALHRPRRQRRRACASCGRRTAPRRGRAARGRHRENAARLRPMSLAEPPKSTESAGIR